MGAIKTEIELRNAIVQLQGTQALEGKLLKEQFELTYESLKPINLIKNTMKEAAASTEIKDSLLNTSIGLAAAYFSRKLFAGVSHEPMRKLLGTALMLGITTTMAKNPVTVKAVVLGLKKIFSRGNDAFKKENPPVIQEGFHNTSGPGGSQTSLSQWLVIKGFIIPTALAGNLIGNQLALVGIS